MTQCVSAYKSCVMRLVRLDECGAPVIGPCSVIVSKGFVSIGSSPDIEEGEEFLQKNACGEPCINEKDCSFLKRINLTISFCNIDPDAVEITTANRALTDATGETIGFATSSEIQCDEGWSLEIWQKIAGQECDTAGLPLWGYWAWPFVTQGTLGDKTFENGPFTFDLTAFTKPVGTDRWKPTGGTDGNVGPFAVLPPTAALLAGEHEGFVVTNVQPPTPVCGCTAFA